MATTQTPVNYGETSNLSAPPSFGFKKGQPFLGSGRDISDGWLEELRGGVMEGLRAPHARVEKVQVST